jgi:exopolyphosphatase/guanosine-5'-triphosphate,3'-diphosphate pyrophosphatase
VGYIIAHESHHKHSLYLIKHSELTGFSETERNIIANVARYHSRALPKERHVDFAALNASERETIWRLGAILRVADALDRRHDARVRDVDCKRDKDGVHLQLRSRLSCTYEVAAVKQKRDMFEEVFDCKLFIRPPLIGKRKALPLTTDY